MCNETERKDIRFSQYFEAKQHSTKTAKGLSRNI
jgi:hypothetical protein